MWSKLTESFSKKICDYSRVNCWKLEKNFATLQCDPSCLNIFKNCIVKESNTLFPWVFDKTNDLRIDVRHAYVRNKLILEKKDVHLISQSIIIFFIEIASFTFNPCCVDPRHGCLIVNFLHEIWNIVTIRNPRWDARYYNLKFFIHFAPEIRDKIPQYFKKSILNLLNIIDSMKLL